jgi:hypothetical protein
MPRIHQEIPMQLRHPARACTLLGLAVLAVSEPAWAQHPPLSEAADAPQPPEAAQSSDLAAECFAEGTRLFKQWRFDEAEAKYREALTHGEHPIFHLYLSRALEKQGRLVEAHEALQPVLRAGIESLSPGDAQEAEKLLESLGARLAQLEVHCDVPGAEVFLDGEPWFTAPGRLRRMTSAGQHVLVAHKPGYFRLAEPVSLFPGKRTPVVLRMTADVVHLDRRWRPWQPRAVAGAGIAMFLAGGLFLWQARTDYATIERDLDACKVAPPCAVSIRRIHRVQWKERISTGVLIAGGSALAAGLAGMLLNLPRTRRSEPARGVEYLDIAPMLSGDAAGMSLGIRF